MAKGCAIRRYSNDGVIEENGRKKKIQIFRASCIPHTNFMSFRSRSARDKWECPGRHIDN